MERRTFLTGAVPSAALLGPWLSTDVRYPQTGGEVRDVRAYGAVGDNLVDDSAAIQRAIEADARGGTIFFPQGAYRIEAPIVLRDKTVLLGHGRHTVLSATTPGRAIVLAQGVKQVFLEGLYMNGNNALRDGIVIERCDDVRIRQCWVTRAGGRGIAVNGTGPIVIDCTIELCGSHGLAVTQTNSGIPLQVIGCSIYANKGDGLHFESNANESTVVANEILSNGGAGIRIMSKSQMLSLTSNVIKQSGGAGVHISGSHLNGLTNNLIAESGEHAILIDEGSDGTVVMGNRCVSNGKIAPDRYATLAVRASRNIIVAGNVLTGWVSPRISQIDSDAASHVMASLNVVPGDGPPP